MLGDPIIINGAVQVTEQDEVTVPGINPDPPEPPEPPVLIPLSVDSNGIYFPEEYDADGFSSVSVEVSSGVSTNALLFHFEDFTNSGYFPCVWNQRTGLSISDSVAKFGEKSLHCGNNQEINNIFLGMDFSLGNQDFTIDFWVYPIGLYASGTYKVPLSFDYRSMAFYLSQQAIQFGIAKSNSAWISIPARTVSITNNEWHHIAITRSGSNVYEFVDGVKVGTVDFGSDSWAPISCMTLGSNTYSTGDRRFEGYIDELRLKLGEAVWTENFSPPTEPYN